MSEQILENQQKTNLQKNKSEIIQAEYYGPLPPPAWMQKYNEINPEIINALLKVQVKEQEHRHKMEEDDLKLYARNSMAGIVYGFVLSAIIIIGGICIIIKTGYVVSGSIVALSGIITSVFTVINKFIELSKNPNKDEKNNK